MRRLSILLFVFVLAVNICRAQTSLAIAGKGMWIWKIWQADSGKVLEVIDTLKGADVTWVVVKMGDSDSYYNGSGKTLYNWAAAYGGMDSVVSIFHNNGIKIFGFQYVYGTPHWGNGISEADVANMILDIRGLDGLIIDAEIQYDTLSDRVTAAQTYLDSIRAYHPTSFVALTSWARVAVHATFPWTTFLSAVAVNMPQTYWAARPTTPQTELSRMSSDFTYYTTQWVSGGDSAASKPIMPLGQAEYFGPGNGNDVYPGDITSFCDFVAADLPVSGCQPVGVRPDRLALRVGRIHFRMAGDGSVGGAGRSGRLRSFPELSESF